MKHKLIHKHIIPMWYSLEAASIEHFLKTGTVSGGFRNALHKIMDEIREEESEDEKLERFEEYREDIAMRNGVAMNFIEWRESKHYYE